MKRAGVGHSISSRNSSASSRERAQGAGAERHEGAGTEQGHQGAGTEQGHQGAGTEQGHHRRLEVHGRVGGEADEDGGIGKGGEVTGVHRETAGRLVLLAARRQGSMTAHRALASWRGHGLGGASADAASAPRGSALDVRDAAEGTTSEA